MRASKKSKAYSISQRHKYGNMRYEKYKAKQNKRQKEIPKLKNQIRMPRVP